MIVRKAESAGFCFGVRRAIEIAMEASHGDGPVYMLGNIVHNEFVVEQIRQAGVQVAEKIDDIPAGTLLLRAHGTIPDIQSHANERGLHIVDATCPMVLEIHRIAKKLEEEGYSVVIIGDHNHDEVRGIAGQVRNARVVADVGDLACLDRKTPKIGVVVQSTQNIENVQQIVSKLSAMCHELKFINTICRPTADHQDEIRRMPKENDVIVVVGSMTSANTRRLTELSASLNPRTHQVQSSAEIAPEWFRGATTVGISAGASTPDAIIQSVVEAILSLSDTL